MRPRLFLLPALIALAAPTVFAATFVVPSDREMVRRAPAIVRGNVLDSFSELTASGSIQTITEVRITEVLKGPLLSGNLVRVASIGGALGSRALVVPGSPQFADGEDVVLFLTPRPDSAWSTVDLTLGKFTRVVSTRGDTLLVRDGEEIFGWDVDGAPHREPVRLAEPFVRFVREVAVGGAGVENYFAPPATVFPRPISSMSLKPQPLAAFPASTYVMTVTLNGITRPVRWPSFGSGIAFRNFGTQSGAPNGGIDSIVAGTAMWTNDCASNVNYSYAGSTSSTQCLNTQPDGIHGIGFNDPCNEIAGSFTGSGILGQGGFWVSSGTNSIESTTFWNITEGNVVLQDNLQAWSHVGEAVYMNALMAHELGHTLGFRHSDQNPDGGACAPASMECSSAAVMKASLTTPYTTLQPWDVNAVGAVYPGGTCGGGGPRVRADFNGNGTSDIWWRNSSSGENSIWYISGNAFVGGATPPPVSTVAVFSGVGDFNNDGRSDVLWRNSSNGQISVWFMNGGAVIGGLTLGTVAATNVVIAGVGDFNGDGFADVLWRNNSNGQNSIWFVNASGFFAGAAAPTVNDPNMNVAAVADFNGNGVADIFWRNSATGANYIWLMNGGTIVGGSQLPTVTNLVTFAGTGDFNGGGTFDLVWRNSATGENSIWYIVNGAFTGGVNLPTVPGINLRIAGIGDFNADGLYDLLWRNDSSGDNSIWYLNGGTIIGGVTLPRINVPELQIVAPKG